MHTEPDLCGSEAIRMAMMRTDVPFMSDGVDSMLNDNRFYEKVTRAEIAYMKQTSGNFRQQYADYFIAYYVFIFNHGCSFLKHWQARA
jgi:hypothetical protein